MKKAAKHKAQSWQRWLGFYRRNAHADNDGLDAAKLAAILLMVTNHVLLAWPWPWGVTGYLIGRPCIPVFAFVLIERLAHGSSDRASRMLTRLIFWAILSQPIYYALVEHFHPRLSILATFAVAAALILLWKKRWWPVMVVGIIATIAADKWLDGGALVVIGMLAGAMLYRHSRMAALACVTLGAIGQNLLDAPGYPLAAVTSLGGPALILLSPLLQRFVPRLPLATFYIFYPLHLLVIWLVYGPYP